MSIEPYERECFVVRCDGCGDHMGGGTEFDVGHYDSLEHARKFISDFDWHQNPDGKTFCPSCTHRSEWADE